jgi:TonB family protein
MPRPSSSRVQALSRPVALHPFAVWLLIALTLLLMSVPRLAGEDLLASARSLYQSAAYDEALTTLQKLSSARDGMSTAAMREIEQYRFLCLVALGRSAEARESMAAVVTTDPLYKLDAGATSPRILAAFQDVRRDMLPSLTTQTYADAKAAYERKDYKSAEASFTLVLSLLEDPDMQGRHADLQTLAKGFLDLSTAGLKAAEAPAAATPAPAAAAARVERRPGVVKPPVTVRQMVPPVPPDIARLARQRSGTLEILIDEGGKVESARFVEGIHPNYDALVLNATRQWRYEPATNDGVPMKFRKTLKVAVQPE